MNKLLIFKRCLSSGIFLLFFVIVSCSDMGQFEGSGDVGNPKLSGSVNYDKATGIYTLKGGGMNMWGTSDEFFIVWKKVSGDFTLSSKIVFEGEGVNPHRKMGLIIRETLDADAVYADVAVHGDGLTSLQYRPSKGIETKEVVSLNTHPDHILLERIGSRLIMKTASGEYPEQIDGEIVLDLPEVCYVGLFICSHEAEEIEAGYFSNVILKLNQQ